jgi:hypothetical protein
MLMNLQQIAIHIYYQIKIACNRPGVIVVSKHYSFKQKNTVSRHTTYLGDLDISFVLLNIFSKFLLQLECYLLSPKKLIKIRPRVTEVRIRIKLCDYWGSPNVNFQNK